MKLLSIVALLQYVTASVLGIDYGAEYTKSSLVAPSIPFEILLTPDSKRKDASGLVMKIKGSDIERIYGSMGLQYTSKLPESSLYYLKSLIGVPFDSPLVEEYQTAHPGLQLVKNRRNGISVRIGNNSYPIEQLVAMNFKEIKGRAQKELEEKLGSGYIKDTAISVPGYFGMSQRRAIADAASLADLQVISLVNDGVAVAVNYASSRQFESKQYIVVYDMGSESTSSTLISIEDKNSTVISVEGYAAIPVGGKTLTTKVRDIIIQDFRDKSGIKDELNTRVLNRLWKEAERAKAVLSANTEVSVFIESLYKDYDLSTKITREQLEKASQDVVDEITTPLGDSLLTFDGEKIEPSQLESIVLAGGGTRVPFVQKQIREYAGNIISKNVNADESAVLGTTLRGVGISGIFKSKPMVVNDKSLHSFSLGDGKDETVVFPRGSKLDSTKSLNFPVNEIGNLTIFEDSDKVVSWSFPLASSMVKNLETEERKCITEPELSVRFHLSNSEVVELTDAQVRCKTAPVTTDESDESTLDTKTTSRSINAKRYDFAVTPISTADREELSYGIRKLDKQDSDRVHKQTTHNKLEALLYQIRDVAPDNERAQELLEECEDDLDIEKLNEYLKEAELLFEKHDSVARLERATYIKSCLAKAGLDVEGLAPLDIGEAIGNATLAQLEAIKIEREGPVYEDFQGRISMFVEAKRIMDYAESVTSEYEKSKAAETASSLELDGTAATAATTTAESAAESAASTEDAQKSEL